MLGPSHLRYGCDRSESLDLVEPVARPSLNPYLYDKNSVTIVKLLQQQIDTLKLEAEKLRLSNLMLLKREACNTSVIRNMEQQLRRLSDENFSLQERILSF